MNIRVCNQGCSDCYDLDSNDDNHQCIGCKSGYYPIENINNNCYKIEEMIGSNYYLDEDVKIFKRCNESYGSCYKTGASSNNNCIECLRLALAHSYELINGSDFIAMVLSSDDMDPKEQIEKGISAINLGNCIDKIKEYYNIPKNEGLIILNNETKINEE